MGGARPTLAFALGYIYIRQQNVIPVLLKRKRDTASRSLEAVGHRPDLGHTASSELRGL